MSADVTTVVATAPGGPEVLAVRTVPALAPGPGEVVVDVAAAGVNFIDTYRRSGVYPMHHPGVLGSEGAGTVTLVGDGVTEVRAGDRVAWCDAPGSYASQVLLAADRAIPVPDDVELLTAAALPLQGLTAHYLTTSTFAVAQGQDVLVHAGAGGVGLLLTQLAAHRGARVITTVSTPVKAELSRGAGADAVIVSTELDDLTRDLPVLVRDLTDGQGVHVAYDSVGKDTFDASLASVRTRGMLVLLGGSSGQVPPFDLQRLNAAGSLTVTRPSLAHHITSREELLSRSGDLFRAVSDGSLTVRIGATYPLEDAARAHVALESRRTTGKVLLIP